MAFSPTLYTTTITPLPSLSLPRASSSLSVSVPYSTAHSCTRPRATPPGYLSVIHRAVVEEEEYRKARAEVNRKGTELEGLSVEGFSIGGMETCIVLPTFNSVFDMGRCPSRAVHQDFLFITHAHLDHIGSLPMYLATRGLYSLKPPTVFVPPCIKKDVERLLEVHHTMSNVELNVDLVALDADMILVPEVAFTGDTTSDFILDPRNSDALRAKVLITEATFLDEEIDVEHAKKHGHMHISEIMEHAKWFRNEAILLTHFSSRYTVEQVSGLYIWYQMEAATLRFGSTCSMNQKKAFQFSEKLLKARLPFPPNCLIQKENLNSNKIYAVRPSQVNRRIVKVRCSSLEPKDTSRGVNLGTDIRRKKLAIFVSGGGSNFRSIHEASIQGLIHGGPSPPPRLREEEGSSCRLCLPVTVLPLIAAPPVPVCSHLRGSACASPPVLLFGLYIWYQMEAATLRFGSTCSLNQKNAFQFSEKLLKARLPFPPNCLIQKENLNSNKIYAVRPSQVNRRIVKVRCSSLEPKDTSRGVNLGTDIRRKKLAIFVSGGGSNFRSIHEASIQGLIHGDISHCTLFPPFITAIKVGITVLQYLEIIESKISQTVTCIKTKTASMCSLLLLSLIFLLVLNTTPCSACHIININSTTTLQFSSLVWDPTAQHFVAGSAIGPTIYAISDEGTVKCLLSEPFYNSSGVSVTALAVDQIRLRLIVAFSKPSSVIAYDLKSYWRIYAVPLPDARRGVVLKVGLQRDSMKVISEFKISGDKGLGGIVYLSHGYIIVLQKTTGKILKVDTKDGTVKEVLPRDSSIPLAPSGHAIVLQTEKSIAVATNQNLLIIESDDNSWARGAAIKDKMMMEEGEMVVAVAIREGENVYVLLNSQKRYMIKEAVWEESIPGYVYVLGGSCIGILLLYLLWETLNDKNPANTPYGHVYYSEKVIASLNKQR
ncbi:ribonuclease Z [Carex littledalei]|uniref:Ribonuclease Z n=1 Tax=Carex littledalei TaxID=544730 RepID=A0A833R598_9POAL|nr:ribonuclease Z [Carex littledalei]